MKKIKVLFITHAPWRNDTSIGNSYSNIFSGMEDKLECAQIYIRDGYPENDIVNRYFYISEKELIKSILTRKNVGHEIIKVEGSKRKPEQFSNSYNAIRSLRWNLFLLVRDVIGILGKWKTKELDCFLREYKPDVIFGALSFLPIVNKLMIYASQTTGAKLIVYPWDDWYHINKHSKSPFYFMRILLERRYIKKCTEKSSLIYTITEQMRNEYTELFEKPCKVLRKGYRFNDKPTYVWNNQSIINMVYAGNIGDNRWRSLAKLASIIEASNKKSKIKVLLKIHTLTPINQEMERQLNIQGACEIGRPLAAEEVSEVLLKSDVLVHVEPMDTVMLENCRLSFSTKIVDYLNKARCILAVGGENASMRYLKDNDAAIVANTMDEMRTAVEKIVNDTGVIKEYADKAWVCGCKNHSIDDIQNMLYEDFLSLIKIGVFE